MIAEDVQQFLKQHNRKSKSSDPSYFLATFFKLDDKEDWKRIWPDEVSNPLKDESKVPTADYQQQYDYLSDSAKQKMDEIIEWCKEYEREGKNMDELKESDGKTQKTSNLEYPKNQDMYSDICTVPIEKQ